MKAPFHPLFSEQDLEAIRVATVRAEARTSGEVVSYCVARCDEYPEAAWKAMALSTITAVLLAGCWNAWAGFWGTDLLWILGPPSVGAPIGWLLAQNSAVRRFLVDAELIDRRVRLRAESAFLEEEVFKTRDRTGVLLFLSLFEHKVVILADEGIHAQVDASEWERISGALAVGIRGGRATGALIEAIEACGELLEHHRVDRREDDKNELGDELRIRHE